MKHLWKSKTSITRFLYKESESLDSKSPESWQREQINDYFRGKEGTLSEEIGTSITVGQANTILNDFTSESFKKNPTVTVLAVQAKLKALGYTIEPDGLLGPNTKYVIAKFQAKNIPSVQAMGLDLSSLESFKQEKDKHKWLGEIGGTTVKALQEETSTDIKSTEKIETTVYKSEIKKSQRPRLSQAQKGRKRALEEQIKKAESTINKYHNESKKSRIKIIKIRQQLANMQIQLDAKNIALKKEKQALKERRKAQFQAEIKSNPSTESFAGAGLHPASYFSMMNIDAIT